MNKYNFDCIIDSSDGSVEHINEKYDKIKKLNLIFNLIKFIFIFI